MSKQISANELAAIVTCLLTDTQATGELDDRRCFQWFMTDIAQVVCDYCGGEVCHSATLCDGDWYIGVHSNDSLPDTGGIWKEYDAEGVF